MLPYPRVMILRLILENTLNSAFKIIKWKHCQISKDSLALYFKAMGSSSRKLGDRVIISVDTEHGFKREKHSNQKWLVFFFFHSVLWLNQVMKSHCLNCWLNEGTYSESQQHRAKALWCVQRSKISASLNILV